ncbi:MAG: glycosyltransferase family 2 protein [Thermoproteota archaeon]|nr:glycosyltransferase family 2 protein [Thermoproteota archaeon]
MYKVTRERKSTSPNMQKPDTIVSSTASMAIRLRKHGPFADLQEDIGTVKSLSNQLIDGEYPFISILVATYNESLVIDGLLKSFASLSYPADKFEIIIVDDSSDDTYEKIQRRLLTDMYNLRVIHRQKREGWKGGALNVALDAMDKRTSYVLVLDADNILLADTLERCISLFIENQYCYRRKGFSIVAIQGFPISKTNLEYVGEWENQENVGNWTARAIDFRLSQRNMIEFTAKELLHLPVQITGSLFMMRADMLKSIKFCNDLCEDWELTLDVYCCSSQPSHLLLSSPSKRDVITSDNITKPVCNHNFDGVLSNPTAASLKPRIIFDQRLVSYCEATTDLAAYFRQRMRVSEGHTRGLRRRIKPIAHSSMLSLVDKVELFLNGLQYAKFTFVIAVGIVDIILILMHLLDGNNNPQLVNLFGICLSLQAINLAVSIVRTLWATKICQPVRRYNIKDVLSLIVLYMITAPAFVIGSLRGFLCNKGIFYRTERNLRMQSKLNKDSLPSDSKKSSSSYAPS